MPNVKCDVELSYADTPRTAPASSLDDFTYTPPSGYQLISWGVSSFDTDLHIEGAYINSDNLFRGFVQNTSATDLGFRWTFVLMKI